MNKMNDQEVRELWNRGKEIYLSTISDAQEKNKASRYLAMINQVALNGNHFEIVADNAYTADFIRENFADKIKTCLNLIGLDKEVELKFSFSERVPAAVAAKPRTQAIEAQPVRKVSTFISTLPLNDAYTFEEFVQGPSNSFAYSAAKGVVNHPGEINTNPLFIHGGTGLGKTHLMQAIGNELKRINPGLAVCYLTAETFLNEYVNALQQHDMVNFRNKYRTIDVLLIDDVQFLQRGKNCQEEFFNTFNVLTQAKKQIVMTSDVAPKHIPDVEQRLISRFEGGLVQEIESPNYETRLAILRKKSESADIFIPDEALQFIADNIKSHVRAMEGALRKIIIFRQMDSSATLNNETLNHLLKDFIEQEQTIRNVTIEEIQNVIAKHYSISMYQMLSQERTQSLVTPRQLAMYIARKYSANSLQEIAKKFEKTHATIIHGVKSIEKRLDVEETLKANLAEILSKLGYRLSDRMD